MPFWRPRGTCAIHDQVWISGKWSWYKHMAWHSWYSTSLHLASPSSCPPHTSSYPSLLSSKQHTQICWKGRRNGSRKGRKRPSRKKVLHALISNPKLTVQRVGFCSQVCQSLVWRREQDHMFWRLLHGLLARLPLGWWAKSQQGDWQLGKSTPSVNSASCSLLEWITGADTWGVTGRFDAFLCMRYYSWKNKFEGKRSRLRAIRGIYWGMMWDIYLVHQVATIIFPYLSLFSGSFSLAERRKIDNIPGVAHRRGAASRGLLLLHWQGRLEELTPQIVQEINTLDELFFRHFRANTISPEESESEKHKCVDIKTGQGVPINNPGVLIHHIDIEQIKQQGCSICMSSILLQHSQIFIFWYIFPLTNPV